MEDAYAPYFQGLTAALELFKECKAKNAKFRHYIKVSIHVGFCVLYGSAFVAQKVTYLILQEKEKDRSIDKQKIEYLLNNPMQQLTSRVGVTLKGMYPYTLYHFMQLIAHAQYRLDPHK